MSTAQRTTWEAAVALLREIFSTAAVLRCSSEPEATSSNSGSPGFYAQFVAQALMAKRGRPANGLSRESSHADVLEWLGGFLPGGDLQQVRAAIKALTTGDAVLP